MVCLIENAEIVFNDDLPALNISRIEEPIEHIATPMETECQTVKYYYVVETESKSESPKNEMLREQSGKEEHISKEHKNELPANEEVREEQSREVENISEELKQRLIEEEIRDRAYDLSEVDSSDNTNTSENYIEKDYRPENKEAEPNSTESESSSDTESDTTPKSLNRRKKNKLLRMHGQSYVGFRRPRNQNKTFQDTKREERKLGDRCMSRTCRKSTKRNCDNISDDIRQEIFSSFWKNLSWNQRKVYVSNLVIKQETLRKTKEESRRNISFYYFLNVGDKKVPVCKQMFLNTLGLREWCIRNWVNSAEFGTPKRRHSRIRDLGHQKRITDFLEALPKLPSHYCRKDSKKMYLEQDFKSYSDLYKAYTLYANEGNEKLSCRTTFMNSVNELNIAIFKPRKDMCDTCVEYESGNLPKVQWEKHIKEKERAQEEKRKDKENAERKECYVLTMDLQAVKTCPAKQASMLYFKTKLCCHNFTLFDLAIKEVICYWFDETDTDLQASTFATMVVDFIKRKSYYIDKDKPIIIYSDGCTYQNRNAVLANALLSVSYQYEVTIIQKFLVKGHSQMECDSVHATIEKRLKNKDIEIPNDFHRATIDARQKPFPYEVVSPKYNFFINYNTNLVYESIRPGKKTNEPTVTQIRALRYEKGVIYYTLDFDHEFKELPRRPKGKPKLLEDFPRLHENKLPITYKKYKHLQEIKSKIDENYWPFYDNLPHVPN